MLVFSLWLLVFLCLITLLFPALTLFMALVATVVALGPVLVQLLVTTMASVLGNEH